MTPPATMRRRLLPSLGEWIFCTILVLLFLPGNGSLGLLGDSDTGWHIRTGQWILDHSATPRQDPFSFSKPAAAWFAWEWLSDVLLALVHHAAGLTGVMLTAGLVIASVFAALYRLLVRQGADVVVAAGVALAACYASSIHWLARPHLFSWALALAFYWILEQVDVRRRAIWWLVPLAALWTNLHASFGLGLLLVAIYGAGELLRALLAEGDAVASLRRAARYGLVLAACSAATFLNPYGFRVHLHILSYLKSEYIRDHITEFFSPNFHAPPAWFFEALLLLGIASAIWAIRRGRYTQALLIAGFAHASLQSARHIPFYALFAAPVIAQAITAALDAHRSPALAAWLRRLLGGIGRFGRDIGRLDGQPRWHLFPALVTVIVAVVMLAPAATPRRDFDPKLFPVAATDFLERSSFAGNVFSTDQWSGYLIYRAFPRVRVFLDGRSDYYGPQLGELYLRLLAAHHTWKQTLDQYRVDAVLLPVECGLTGTLKESSLWQVAYDDGVAIVFHRADDAPTARLLAASGNTRPTVSTHSIAR